jgi:hypothetical protein
MCHTLRQVLRALRWLIMLEFSFCRFYTKCCMSSICVIVYLFSLFCWYEVFGSLCSSLSCINVLIFKRYSVDILQWMKHGYFTTLQSPIDSQPSELKAMNRIQSVERRNGQLARLWHHYSGMRVVLYSSITLKRARPSTASITWRYWSV